MNVRQIIHDFYYCFGVRVDSDTKNHFKLEHNSPIQHERVTGVKIRRRYALITNKSVNNNDLVNDNCLFSSFLTLKQRNTEVFEKIPMELIWYASEQGKWFEIDIPIVDMSQSEVMCSDPTTLVEGEEFEFVFRYKNTIIQKDN